MSWYIHLAIASEPGGPLSAICGEKVANPVPVALGPETESPLDLPRLHKKCRELAMLAGLRWETAIQAGEEELNAGRAGSERTKP